MAMSALRGVCVEQMCVGRVASFQFTVFAMEHLPKRTSLVHATATTLKEWISTGMLSEVLPGELQLKGRLGGAGREGPATPGPRAAFVIAQTDGQGSVAGDVPVAASHRTPGHPVGNGRHANASGRAGKEVTISLPGHFSSQTSRTTARTPGACTSLRQVDFVQGERADPALVRPTGSANVSLRMAFPGREPSLCGGGLGGSCLSRGTSIHPPRPSDSRHSRI